MATGTGLPIPKGGDVLAQAPGMVSGDALHNAQQWQQIASAGDKIAKEGFDQLQVSQHQAQVGYLSQQEVDIARRQTEMRNEHADNPAAFDAAWKSYTDMTLTSAEPWAVPKLKVSLGQHGNAAFSAILNQTRQQGEARAKEGWTALESMASNDVTGAAMAGTLGTPEGQVKLEKYRGVIDTGVTSKFIAPEEGDRRWGQLESAAAVYGSRSTIKSTFDADGPIAANASIDEIIRDEKLKLSPEQRNSLGARLRADVHAWDAERRQSLSEVDVEAKSLIAARQGGIPIDQSRIDETVTRYRKFGGQAQAATFLADMQHVNEMSFLSRAPLSESTAYLESLKAKGGFNTPRGTPEQAAALNDTAGRLGIAPRDLAAAISYETGGTFNPNIKGGKGGNYAGLIQFGPEERAKYGVTPGMTFEQQMGAVEGFLRDRGVKPGMGVSEIYRTINGGNPNAPLTASDGNGTIAEHVQRIQAGHYGNADRFLGAPAVTGKAAASDTTFLGQANAAVVKRVNDEADAVIAGMKDGVLPSSGRIDGLLQAASATNNAEALTKVAQAAGEYQFRRQFGRAPLPTEQAIVGDLEQKARTEGLDATEARRLQIATSIRDETAKALADDPLAHTIAAMGDVSAVPKPVPLDVGNQASFRAGLASRATWADMGARTFETGAMPALTAAEVTQVRAALDAADPRGKARIYSDIVSSLPGPVRAATLSKLGDKGVDGMVEAFAGGMTGVDPAIGESIIRGQSAMKAKESFNPLKGGNKDDVTAALDKYMPASAFTLAARTDPQGAYATMRGAVLARAADLAATDPGFKNEFPEAMIQRAVNDVTGGMVVHNGATAFAPRRGMTQREFDQRIWGLTDNDLAGVTTQSGTPVTAKYLRDNAQLESLSDGRYLVRLGRDAERPVYAFQDLGVQGGARMRPFILDLRNVTPATNVGGTLGGIGEFKPYPRG